MAIATRPTDADVTEFLDAVPDARRRAEGHALRALMERVTGEPAVLWGTSIVGFGSRPYTNTAGTSDWFVVGFSPRKGALTVYGVHDGYAALDPLLDELADGAVAAGRVELELVPGLRHREREAEPALEAGGRA